jgi:hypothetical protein
MRTKNRAARVRDTFREYLTSCRDHTGIIARRAPAVSPAGQEPVMRDCFRLQTIFIEGQAMRFDFLLKSKTIHCARFKSLDDIGARLDKEWMEAEEGAIRERNPHYGNVSREIDAIQSRWGADAAAKLHQDPKYRDASEAMADGVAQLQKRMRA